MKTILKMVFHAEEVKDQKRSVMPRQYSYVSDLSTRRNDSITQFWD